MFENLLSPWHLILILLIAMIFFGPGKLPEFARGLGNAVNEFKRASNGMQKEFQEALKADNSLNQASQMNESKVDPSTAPTRE